MPDLPTDHIEPAPAAVGQVSNLPENPDLPAAKTSTGQPSGHAGRLRKLPVAVIVKLAEKRIEMGQLLAMGSGSIIMFEKSCEDLLDLYVNNKLYCRGEAVKIGEKFGIKVCEVGSVRQRVSAVMAPE